MTVSLDRLDRVKMGNDPAAGKRLYASGTVTPADFKAIQKLCWRLSDYTD